MKDELLNIVTHHISYFKNVEKIVLFGSRARGDHRDRSDYDLAIFGEVTKLEMNEISFYLQEGVRTLHSIDFVFTKYLNDDDKIMQNILSEGVTIYDRKQIG